LHCDNNITTGKIYQAAIEKERHGDYLGKTVQGKIAVPPCGGGIYYNNRKNLSSYNRE
jgi:hypothetical protein